MKNFKHDFGSAGQSTKEVKKPHKHDANLQKNSSLYFQIGLILCLLGTYALFEMQFQETDLSIIKEKAQVDPIMIDYVPPFIEEVIEKQAPKPKSNTVLKDKVKEVDNDKPLVETVIDSKEDLKPIIEEPTKIVDVITVDEPSEPVIVDFVRVESVPVYPGCEKYTTNEDRRQCMSDKINKLVGRKFNVDIGSEYGISGRQKIFTQFTIDKNGSVTDVKIRGPHHALQSEAERVLNIIPKMQPGLQRQVPVSVIYTLPIMYDARN